MRVLFIFVGILSCMVPSGTCVRGPPFQECYSAEFYFTQPPATEPCYGNGLCHCSNITANCSLTFGKLNFVPFLKRTYQVLNFSFNNISTISDDFFVNTSRDVRLIDLQSNGLRFIGSAAFRPLRKLTTLLLGGLNYLRHENIPPLLAIPSLLNISFHCVGLKHLPDNAFYKVTGSKLSFFDLSVNKIRSLNMSVFQPLQDLEVVNLSQNKIHHLKTAYLPSWQTMYMNNNRLYKFKSTCAESSLSGNSSLFPNLRELILDNNMIRYIIDPVCLPKLEVLSLNFNKFAQLYQDTFSSSRFPVLKILNIMGMENKIQGIEKFFINNSEVRFVNVMRNEVYFASDVVDERAFHGCTNLEKLLLKGNKFKDVSDEKFSHLFRDMRHSLRFLELGEVGLEEISSRAFHSLFQLVELRLYDNGLSFIPDGAFDTLNHLEKLALDHNHIAVISESTFSPRLRNRLKTILLNSNPFQCTCDIRWFQGWLRSEPDKFFSPGYKYKLLYQCTNEDVAVSHFVINEQACLLDHSTSQFFVLIVSLLIIFFFLFLVSCRYRWHVRLLIYEICRGRQRRCLLPDRRFTYDVFVSYAEENEWWVENELIPRLEGEWGLRLCIHQRDFIPGKHIVDNICDCVKDSSRVMLVFSPDFARSKWCQFELKYCQMCVMERSDVMVLVALQETRSRDMTGAMMAVLKTTTYIEWEENRDARASFWARLRLALKESEEV